MLDIRFHRKFGNSEFPHYKAFLQFSFFKNMLNMLIDRRLRMLKIPNAAFQARDGAATALEGIKDKAIRGCGISSTTSSSEPRATEKSRLTFGHDKAFSARGARKWPTINYLLFHKGIFGGYFRGFLARHGFKLT